MIRTTRPPLAVRTPSWCRWLVLSVVVAAAAAGGPGVAAVRAQQADAPALKAAFVLTFAKFVEWPPSEPQMNGGPVVVCVADGIVADALDAAVIGHPPKARRFRVRHVDLADSFDGCAVLYVGRLNDRRLAAVLEAVGASSVLTISDSDDFARRGGVIHLYVKEGRMRFAVNTQAATKAQLRLSVRLLSLADAAKDW